MKKVLLITVGALLAGSIYAQSEINGVKISEGSDKGNYHYYRIRNLQATELDATAANPYMGLSILASNWFPSFTDNEQIKSPITQYWYFTASKEGNGSVEIRNAVISGSMANEARHTTDYAGYKRQNIVYNTKLSYYYVLPVGDNMTFAFSNKPTLSDVEGENQCLKLNDFINVTERIPVLNEAGDTLRDENNNYVYDMFGFYSLNLSNSPVNVDNNPGAVFILEPAETADALAAIQAYEDLIWHKPHDHEYLFQINNAITTIEGWKKLPALFNESAMAKLADIQKELEECKPEFKELYDAANDKESSDKMMELIYNTANSKLNEAAALVGKGCIVRLQNQLSLKDLDRFVNSEEEVDERLQLGNAYIAAGGDPTYRYKNQIYYMSDDKVLESFVGTGIEPRLEPDAECEWELIPIENTITYLLYNRAKDSYIRKYHNLYEYYGGKDIFIAEPDAISEFSWVTTHDKADAAPFAFIGCANPDTQTTITDTQKELLDAAGLDTEVENKVRLQAIYTYEVLNSASGKTETHEALYQIHRGSAESDYRFYNWGPTFNNWFADSNAFELESVEMGGISEITAQTPAKPSGIYDLQGRRVANPGKGLYIVNGQKTLIR